VVCYLGNMGYPVITRLGISQFWYSHWYADTRNNYLRNFENSQIFIKLLKLYLKYGLLFSNPIFFHEHFFQRYSKSTRSAISIRNLRYYRKFYFSNYNLSIEHSYLLRYRTGEYFPLRLWLIKYSNWFVLCFNAFKPIKRKANFKVKLKSEYYATATSLEINRDAIKFNRFKLLYLYLVHLRKYRVNL